MDEHAHRTRNAHIVLTEFPPGFDPDADPDEQVCSECGGQLDTGWECNDCGLDFGHLMSLHINGTEDQRPQ